MPPKKVDKKTPKELKREIDDKSFGMKNKKNSRELKKAIHKLTLQPKKEDPARIQLLQPRAPIGTDPKTIPCVYYINKLCDKGDKCKYGHEKAKHVSSELPKRVTTQLVCRFMIDAINEGQYNKSWSCPNGACSDIHKLSETANVEISIEEFIEMKRQDLCSEVFISEEMFLAWKMKKKDEDRRYKENVRALRAGVSGAELFMEEPGVFVDDEEALDVDYNERNYEDENEGNGEVKSD